MEDVISGEKIAIEYDPTQRITQIDPDVEAEITGSDRDVPGDKFPGAGDPPGSADENL